MSIFYHVSQNLNHNGVFEPRIPEDRCDTEDDSIKRVCVAPSIEDCLTSMPGGGCDLNYTIMCNRGLFLVFRIDTEKIGISESNIVASETLFKEDLVRDAEISDEHWITTGFTVPKEDIFLIKLLNWNEDAVDIIPNIIYEMSDNDFGDYSSLYMSVYKGKIPSTIKIEDAIYLSEKVSKDDLISIYYNEEFEYEGLSNYLNNNNSLGLNELNNNEGNLVLRATKDCSIKNLLLYHKKILDDFYC